jgi:TolA-binding protein
MLGRRIVGCCRAAAASIVVLSSLLATAPAEGQSTAAPDAAPSNGLSLATASDPRAAERFRTAAALANRELYDLAAKDWAQLVADFPRDPLARRARFERGVCLFRLEQFADARSEFRALLDERDQLDTELAEACYAHLGLAEYNLGRETKGTPAIASLEAAAATFDEQLQQFPTGGQAAESAFYRGEALYALGRLDAAVAAYQACLKSFPRHPRRAELCHALGVAQQEQGDAPAAAETFARFIAECPQHEQTADAQLRRGEALLALGRPVDAEPCFTAVAEKCSDPEMTQRAAYLAASAALRAGDVEMAGKHAAEFVERFPNSRFAAEVGQIAAEVQLQQAAYDEAAAAFKQLLVDYPQHSHCDAWTVRQAHCQMLGQSRREAIRILEPMWRGIGTTELRAEAALVLGTSYFELGRAADAVEVLTVAAALPRWSQADEVLFTLAQAEQAQGQAVASMETLDELIDDYPESSRLAGALALRGELNAASQNATAALADFDRLLAVEPNTAIVPRALLAKARVEYAQHRLDAAEASLDRFLKSHREHELATDALLLRAAVLHERGDFALAIADAEMVVAIDPPRPKRSDAIYTRGLCELGLGQPAAAVEAFSRIVQKDPQYRAMDRVLYDLAWAYQQSQNATQATATFARLVEKYPESPLAAESSYHAGEAQFTASNFAAAAKSFWIAGERATDAVLAEKSLHKLAWSCFEQGQFEPAAEAFDRQIADHPHGPLAADAMLMIGECRFEREQFSDALAAFDTGLDQSSASESIRELALLHAGQAAGQLGQWERSLELLDTSAGEFPAGRWSDQARYERGWALYRLDRLDEAEAEFNAVAADNADVLGARAQFMVGEVMFKRRQFDDAVRKFFQVAYGYGDGDAAEPFHHWQAEAMFEAARCLEETERFESARKLYEELLERHPTSEKAAFARNSLQQIMRR